MIKPITKSKQIRENFNEREVDDDEFSLTHYAESNSYNSYFSIERDDSGNITKITLTKDLTLSSHLLVNTEFTINKDVKLTIDGKDIYGEGINIDIGANYGEENVTGTINNYGSIECSDNSLDIYVGYNHGHDEIVGSATGTFNNYGSIECSGSLNIYVGNNNENEIGGSATGTFNNYGSILVGLRGDLQIYIGYYDGSGSATGTFNNCSDKLKLKVVYLNDKPFNNVENGKSYTSTNNGELIESSYACTSPSPSSLKYWLIGISVLILIIVLILVLRKKK